MRSPLAGVFVHSRERSLALKFHGARSARINKMYREKLIAHEENEEELVYASHEVFTITRAAYFFGGVISRVIQFRFLDVTFSIHFLTMTNEEYVRFLSRFLESKCLSLSPLLYKIAINHERTQTANNIYPPLRKYCYEFPRESNWTNY